MSGLVAKIRERRAWNICPAYEVPCTRECFMRGACVSDPAGVMRLVERLDQQTLEALARIACDER